MKTFDEHVTELGDTILITRDFCGSVREAIADYYADFGFSPGPERDRVTAAALQYADRAWCASQRAAGVTRPIHSDERASIHRTLEQERRR